MYKLFFLILFSVSSLLALPLLFPDGLPAELPPSYANSRIAIGFNPANITPVYNGRNITPDVVIALVEEELTKSNCSKDSNMSYVLVGTEDPRFMKKSREVIEKQNSNENLDPASRITPHFIAATHLLKGSAAVDRGCAMVNLRIEDRKGCIIAQKKISVSGIRKPIEIIDKLIVEATSSLRYQICNSKSNEQTCSKSHYTDELLCPYYFTITTKIEHKEDSRKDRGANVMIDGPKSLISSWNTTQISKQIMHVDTANGSIRMLALEGDAHSSRQGSYHQFNDASCTYELKSKTSKDENLNYAMTSLKHHNIGLVDDDKATIELQVRSTPFKKKFSIDWRTLQNSGSWSGHGSYNKSNNGDGFDLDVPEGLEGLSGITNTIKDLVANIRKEVGPKSKEMIQMGIDNFGRSKKENCHQKRVHEGFFVSENKTSSMNIEVDINIRDATNYEISLMEKISDDEDIRSYEARKKPVKRKSNYEKGASSSLDAIESMMYDQLSNADKKAWDRADKEHKDAIQSKKDVEEFNTLSIDDLEMFVK